MYIDLNSRIENIQPKLEAWWNHEDQEFPCLLASRLKPDHKNIPKAENIRQFWTDVDFVIERQMKVLENTEYFGMAVPFHYIDYGSSAMACVYGSRPDYKDEIAVWAHPVYKSIEEILHIGIDPENEPWQTILKLIEESTVLATNHHMVAMFALMGMTDILAGLYGTENFLMDFLIKP